MAGGEVKKVKISDVTIYSDTRLKAREKLHKKCRAKTFIAWLT